ncbi:MAG: cytochrome c oxidase subunit II [Pseudomonadota bacterium]|nr:cytochrome c oxidase subunit II [Pseudomonadota bacterium]
MNGYGKRDLLVAGLVVAQSDLAQAGPMSYLHTFGPAGYPVTTLGWGLGIISVSVCVIITLLLLGAIFRRHKEIIGNVEEHLVVHEDAGGMAWIYIGVGISTVVLIGAMIWTLVVTAVIAKPVTPAALTVQVQASQWWWGLRYDSETSSRTFTTANEIHIPTGQPVQFVLTSTDVIHSFWVPKLGGKKDIIPGQANVTWLQADAPGVYRGQCAVFCGAEHARMALLVIAQTPRDFRAWQEAQIAATPTPRSMDAYRGQEVFLAHCAACHAIRGSDAGGLVGPDLTHLMSRYTLAAGVLTNTPGNLAGWIVHPQAIKPDSRMPDQTLSGPQLHAVVTYLETLQ